MSEIQSTAQETSTGPISATPEIPKDLSDLWGSVQVLAMAFRVIKEATHQQHNFQGVDLSLKFLKDLHDQSLANCQAHASAALIPELKQIKEQFDVLKKAEEKRAKKSKKKEAQHGEKEASH